MTRWPPAPDPTASNLEHALLYHALPLGLWLLPGRDELDLRIWRGQLRAKFERRGDAPEVASRKAAEHAERGRKHTFVSWREMSTRPTEDDLRDWFAERPMRPVVALTGPDRGTCVVDVDPLRGGVPEPWVGAEVVLRTLDGSEQTFGHRRNCAKVTLWSTAPECTCDGPRLISRTPSSGWHAFHLAADVGSSEGKDDLTSGRLHGVADGVDIRGKGGLVVLPSGDVATPGRRWERWRDPTPFPLAEVERRLADRAGRAGHVLRDTLSDSRAQQAADLAFVPEGAGREQVGSFAHAVTVTAPDGTKNPRAKIIVGMLARGAPLPADACAAALGLLEEWSASRMSTWDRDVLAALRAGWEAQLAAPSRSQQFATEVLLAWDELRCRPRWGREKVEDTAARLWRTSASAERLRALMAPAEDAPSPRVPKSELAPLAAPDPGEEPLALLEQDEGGETTYRTPTTVAGLPDLLAQVLDCDREEAEAQAAVLLAEGVLQHEGDASLVLEREAALLAPEEDEEPVPDPDTARRRLLPTFGSLYGAEQLEADLGREVLSLAVLPRWQAHGGGPDDTARCGHGIGEGLDLAFGGGIRPGQFVVLGAESAKAMKTALVDQLLDGIMLRSALVLSGTLTGPVVVAYYLTEMSPADLTHRQLGRWLGVDSTVFRRGRDKAHEAPGLRRLAARLGRDARPLAAEYHAAADAALRGGLLARARDLRVVIQPRRLPGPEDHKGPGRPKDHRRGVLLVRAVTESIRQDRAAKAIEWGREEREVWPLLFVDPLQRFQREGDGDAVGALDELVEELKAVADEEQIIVIATSDTNKESAKGQRPKNLTPYQLAAHVFRGSYKLMHLPDLALVLKVTWGDNPGDSATAEVVDALNRWGAPSREPHVFDAWPDTGRFTPRVPTDADPSSEPDAPLGESQSDPVEDEVPRTKGRFAPRKAGLTPGEGIPG